MRPAQALGLVRRLAREHHLTVREVAGRGKGSHRIYVLVDSHGTEVARFGLTGQARDLSWTMMRQLEETLSHQFGEKWTEKR